MGLLLQQRLLRTRHCNKREVNKKKREKKKERKKKRGKETDELTQATHQACRRHFLPAPSPSDVWCHLACPRKMNPKALLLPFHSVWIRPSSFKTFLTIL